jgi:hypothetical protein
MKIQKESKGLYIFIFYFFVNIYIYIYNIPLPFLLFFLPDNEFLVKHKCKYRDKQGIYLKTTSERPSFLSKIVHEIFSLICGNHKVLLRDNLYRIAVFSMPDIMQSQGTAVCAKNFHQRLEPLSSHALAHSCIFNWGAIIG